MLKSHLKYNSRDGKRLVLIVDDEQINREILGNIISQDFDVLYAGGGREALEKIRENRDILSLILLDIMMPEVDGFKVMESIRDDSTLVHIPVIVLTSEKHMEVDCLKMGAFDFIVKPFNEPEVILARIQKTVELSEDRYIIQSTERDGMTGLLTRDYFFSFAQQFDKFHEETSMDALVLDVNHFHLINEIYGRDRGDDVLIEISRYLRDLVEQTGGMATRLESDKFLFYVPHRGYDYEDMFRGLNEEFSALKDINVDVRIGIYENVDKDVDIESRFDRAMRAADILKGNLNRTISYYDENDYKHDIYLEMLTRDMRSSLRNDQFEVYFQPKYDISGDKPFISSAEALIRWNHPTLGRISPGEFIPLFEENGLIHDLDKFVWDKAAEYTRKWEDEMGIVIPVSVNMSRIDLFNNELPDVLLDIIHKHNIPASRLYLEITESAYADTLDQLLDMINTLRSYGFVIEMDDFGAGYSSLNMLADFPIDILKLDMKFIRDMKQNSKKRTMVMFVMKLAEVLNINVIAEGVEEKEQVDFLKDCGCHLIQGYYFARPLPEKQFRLLLNRDVLR